MKVSFYNFFFPYEYEEGKYIAYNSLSNTMALIEEDKYKLYLDFEEKNVEIKDKELIDDLKRGAYILDDELDELDIIRYNMQSARYNTNSLALTIAPTSDCNFRCIYCFEKNAINSNYMTQDTVNSILRYIESKIKNLNNLGITWYGGEPLLAVDIIKQLSESIIKLCVEHNVNYRSSIITNGYNLSKKNWEILKDCKINNIQITVDGNAEIHNSRRPLLGGYPTFDKIISNLVELKEEITPISFRINVDNTNYENVAELLDIIESKGLKNVLMPYLARVDSSNNCYDDSTCLTMSKYSELLLNFVCDLESRGFKVDKRYNYPTRLHSICGCDRRNSLVINADGELYKCWDDIGKTNISIGNINNINEIILNKSFLDYLVYDPTMDIKCSGCKFLPICMGGCPFKRMSNSTVRCIYNINMLQKYLESVAQRILA